MPELLISHEEFYRFVIEIALDELHPSHRCTCEYWTCFTVFPLSVWQEIVFHARQTCRQQTNTLTETKLR